MIGRIIKSINITLMITGGTKTVIDNYWSIKIIVVVVLGGGKVINSNKIISDNM